MRRGTLLLLAGLTGSMIALSLVAVGYQREVMHLLGPLESVRRGALISDPVLLQSLVPLIGLTVARVLLLIGIVLVATGAAAPESATAAAMPASSVPASAVPADLARPVGAAAVVCWVFGLVLFLGGGTGRLVAFVADAEDNATFARQLSELAGSAQGSAAAADALQARSDGVAEALNDYVASSEERVSARNDLVERFNSGVDERNASGEVDIARNQLPVLIGRYQESVADLEAKAAALRIAVERLEEVS
ncbi:MAG TPA: hypothetical protein VLO00_08780 [Cryobacterium sp.]|nr:hypothetical protein [Cryobacterium sp.]